MSAFGQIVG